MGERAELKVKWARLVEQQKVSGKTAFAWCRDNNVNYETFIKRRQRFFYSTEGTPLDPQCFQEIKTQYSESMMEIIYKGTTVRVPLTIDKHSLQECFRILWSCSC